jgi:hypothetical protein
MLSFGFGLGGLASGAWTVADNGDEYGLAQATISGQTIYLYSDSRADADMSYVSSRTALISFGVHHFYITYIEQVAYPSVEEH